MLKIVRGDSAPLRGVLIGETRQKAMQATEVQFKCSACQRTGRTSIPWGATPEARQNIISRMLFEHRVIGCTVKDSTARREYEITYPRG